MLKNNNLFRDLLFFILLITLCKISLERSYTKKSYTWESFPVHELDRDFLGNITILKKQINYLINTGKEHSDLDMQKLKIFKQDLKQIEQKYKKNSPVSFLLGPIGTTSIVLKEKRLEHELLNLINQVGYIVSSLQKKNNGSYLEVASITDGLRRNQQQITLFHNTIQV